MDAVTACRAQRPDVALLYVAMPRLTGSDVAGILRREVPECAVVLVTTIERDSQVQAVLDGGGSFILKASSPEEIIRAIRVAAGGGTYISPRITARLLDRAVLQRSDPAPQGLADLTARELEVLRLVGRGESNHGIARRLLISEGTVKVHVKAILCKLDVDNRVKAAFIAHRWGLCSERPS